MKKQTLVVDVEVAIGLAAAVVRTASSKGAGPWRRMKGTTEREKRGTTASGKGNLEGKRGVAVFVINKMNIRFSVFR
jgi:hypothetical protein